VRQREPGEVSECGILVFAEAVQARTGGTLNSNVLQKEQPIRGDGRKEGSVRLDVSCVKFRRAP
jgi:hypothetical protein